ncbi:hypothetical protein EON67_03335 [archaeon]|nr:MAG: hypothetical protein EON67_03335 [archaeon]
MCVHVCACVWCGGCRLFGCARNAFAALPSSQCSDYREMNVLDTYDASQLDERNYAPMDYDARLAAEEDMVDRDRREGRGQRPRIAVALTSDDGMRRRGGSARVVHMQQACSHPVVRLPMPVGLHCARVRARACVCVCVCMCAVHCRGRG